MALDALDRRARAPATPQPDDPSGSAHAPIGPETLLRARKFRDGLCLLLSLR